MTVLAQFRVDTRPYSGYDDPAFPIASWISQGLVIGDASAGSANIDLLFVFAEGLAAITEMYNLEQLHVDTQVPTTEQILMRTQSMDNLAPNRPAAEQSWLIPLTSTGANDTVMSLVQASGLPLWLGSPTIVGGGGNLDSGLRFEFQNVNLVVYEVSAQGYMWSTRSILAPGGPQRPPFGLFR